MPMGELFRQVDPPRSAEQLAAEQVSGHDDPDNPQIHTLWFPSWWLDRGEFNTGGVTWSTDGQFVWLDVHDSGLRRTWKLTDQYDDHDCRLGVWPD